MMNIKNIKAQLIVFLALFVFYLGIAQKDILFLLNTGIALSAAVLCESIFIYFKERKFLITDSSVISGLIIGLLLSSDQPAMDVRVRLGISHCL